MIIVRKYFTSYDEDYEEGNSNLGSNLAIGTAGALGTGYAIKKGWDKKAGEKGGQAAIKEENISRADKALETRSQIEKQKGALKDYEKSKNANLENKMTRREISREAQKAVEKSTGKTASLWNRLTNKKVRNAYKSEKKKATEKAIQDHMQSWQEKNVNLQGTKDSIAKNQKHLEELNKGLSKEEYKKVFGKGKMKGNMKNFKKAGKRGAIGAAATLAGMASYNAYKNRKED